MKVDNSYIVIVKPRHVHTYAHEHSKNYNKIIVTHTYVAASCQHLSELPTYICMCASHSCFLNSVYMRRVGI